MRERRNCSCPCHGSENMVHVTACCDGVEFATDAHFPCGRFVLTIEVDGVWGYVTSWDTWEEAEVAFEHGRIPARFRLTDDETGRIWMSGARYEWEEAWT